MLKKITAIAVMALIPAAASAQDPAAGEAVFKKCAACHKLDGKNAVGPALNGVVGRKAGTVADYTYSPAMKNSGLTWDEATIDAYLADPKGKIPGNKMVFVGLKEAADRKNVIAYLASKP